MKVDAHQHFWRYSQEEYRWMGSGMEALKADHLPEALEPLLKSTTFEGSVAVQARQTVEETRWLLELADRHAFVKGVVGWVDLRSPRLRQRLERLASHPKLCGVRHVLHDEVDERFMLRKDFGRGIATLIEFDLAYDLLLFPKHLPVASELVGVFPEQRFVVDHVAKPFIKTGQLTPWDADIRRLAAFPNVYCKVSGMVTEADWTGWTTTDFSPYLDIVFEAYGSKRIMFGSDWPVCTVAATYQEVVGIVADYVKRLSAEEQADVWGRTALDFYRLVV